MEVNARNEKKKKLCQYRCMNRSAAELKALRQKKQTNKQTNKQTKQNKKTQRKLAIT